ncbi:MAG TPA: type I restriction-modification system subunit M N-terminal domain-containing protein [Pyrinomonadaceae bacterium]|jgi:type I restriction enzyme M protein
MTPTELKNVENRLWSAADQMWANTGLMLLEYSALVLGLIFLRNAEQRFAEAEKKLNALGTAALTRLFLVFQILDEFFYFQR